MMREWNGHLTEEWLDTWASGQLSETEQQEFLRHVGHCSSCADQLAAYLEKDLMEPPAYLQEEILERSQSADVRTVRKVYEISRRMRLFLYSLKVGFAVAASLFLLFFSSRIEGVGLPQIQIRPELPQISIQERLNDFGNFTDHLFESKYEEEFHD